MLALLARTLAFITSALFRFFLSLEVVPQIMLPIRCPSLSLAIHRFTLSLVLAYMMIMLVPLVRFLMIIFILFRQCLLLLVPVCLPISLRHLVWHDHISPDCPAVGTA